MSQMERGPATKVCPFCHVRVVGVDTPTVIYCENCGNTLATRPATPERSDAPKAGPAAGGGVSQ